MPAGQNQESLMQKWLMKIFAMFILVGFFAGWIIVIAGITEIRKWKAAQTWTAAPGKIILSYASQKRGFKNRKYWDVEIVGEYEGTNNKFYLDRIGFGFDQNIGNRWRAEMFAARYPAGTKLTVYQRPYKSDRVILVRDNSLKSTWICLWIGLFFGMLPFLLYFYGRLTGYRPPEDIKGAQ